YASVFDAVDSYNEVVIKGAFRKTLKENDGKFPLCWSHDVSQPLGIVHAAEKRGGLVVEGHLNLDVQSA
ncbi:MAG: HK97 family phage prohead protease, partial [Candidatus Latescibacteria bacterium]|nr:HK97 family phage prohead protease [Candidatus Latescibacterota bacterium]NIO77432.1 HK97 family phage prohead protease [Candidatus Latescibacterota bacterium]